ncbi:beta-ketoacyl-ACP synthase 3 [Actinomycetospora sp. TBRC 11914]|uniref:beta-ketoacyl-ACP synthase 3 n=1 Tax=Actinomycetospora sp. TBRC 11914 TaxID=2729387 RepID=UPI00145F9EDE|nr:beta-ketoacyl-ACP synthase 3 [Actinomycetospora sp. TBRC 11914]NMO92931.1 beta-ketoacyl-ACP synthase 3 [Actinomycetospora sp. TBRC 11914]
MLGLGAYRPRRAVTNDEVCAHLDVDPDWVLARSGIRTRRFAGPDETVVAMGASAARDALAAAGVDPADVGAVLVATMSADAASPQVATRVAHEVGAVHGAAMDLGAACAGFCYALEVAGALVGAGHGAVLVVGVERMTDIVEPTDRSTAFLFGDGAGAAVVGPSGTPGIGTVAWGADGSQADLIVQSPSFVEHARGLDDRMPALRMQGPAVFRWATTRMPPLAQQALVRAGTKAEQLDAFVPHQANARITDGIVRALGVPEHVAVARDVETAGNTSAASVPLAMHALLTSGASRPGDQALLLGFGAGLTFASQVATLPPAV